MTAQATGDLPDDFPGKTALEDAKVTTFEGVRALITGGILTGVAGIGDATAKRITDAVAAADAAAEEAEPEPAVEASAAAGNTNSTAASPVEATDVERPVSTTRVVCPKCGVGGEVASDEQVGTAECGNADHPGTKLVRA